MAVYSMCVCLCMLWSIIASAAPDTREPKVPWGRCAPCEATAAEWEVGHWTLDLTVAVFPTPKIGTKRSGYRNDKSLRFIKHASMNILWCKGEKYYAVLTHRQRANQIPNKRVFLQPPWFYIQCNLTASVPRCLRCWACLFQAVLARPSRTPGWWTPRLSIPQGLGIQHVQTREIKSSLSKRPSLFLSNSLKASAPVTCSHVFVMFLRFSSPSRS